MKSFRTEFFGFNRKDVSDYIQLLSHSSKEYDKDKEERISELETKLDKTAAQLEDLKSELDEKNKLLEKYISAYNGLCTSISKAIENSQGEILG